MRSGARDAISKAFEGAWDNSQTTVAAIVPAHSPERTWTESEVAELILSHSGKMRDRLQQVVQRHREKGAQWYGPAGELGLGIPVYFSEGLESGIADMFGSLTNAYLDAYGFFQEAETYRRKFMEAKEFVRRVIDFVNNA